MALAACPHCLLCLWPKGLVQLAPKAIQEGKKPESQFSIPILNCKSQAVVATFFIWEQLLPAFVTTKKKKLIGGGFQCNPKNAFDWRLARWMSKISVFKYEKLPAAMRGQLTWSFFCKMMTLYEYRKYCFSVLCCATSPLWVCVAGKENQRVTRSQCFWLFNLSLGVACFRSSQSPHMPCKSIVGKLLPNYYYPAIGRRIIWEILLVCRIWAVEESPAVGGDVGAAGG